MSTLESKPTPSGPKNSNSTHSEPLRSKSQVDPTSTSGRTECSARNTPKKNIVGKKIEILDDWDPPRDSFAAHIGFIHQSLMDLATGIENVGVIDNKINVVSNQLTIMENHLIRIEKHQYTLDKRLENLVSSQDNLYKEQTLITGRITKIEEHANSKESLHKEHLSIANRIVKMEERLQGKIEDSKVELSTTFETEAEVCRNIYITETINQINSIKTKSSSVRYVGKKDNPPGIPV